MDSRHLEKVLEDEDFLQQASGGLWEGSTLRFYGSSIPEQDSIPRNDAGFMTALCPASERLFDFPFHFLFVWGVLLIPHPVSSSAFQVFCIEPMLCLEFFKRYFMLSGK